ncbi:MAG: histidinol dehydrogenase [bacterium]
MIKLIDKKDIQKLILKRKGSYDDIYADVRNIIDKIKKHGDRALLEFRKLYDHITDEELIVSKKVLQSAERRLSKTEKEAFRFAIKRVYTFHKQEKKRMVSSWRFKEGKGISYGELFTPIERVGIYVPGGSASYPSTVIMNVIPALVAGVKEITMVTPSQDYHVFGVANMLGVDKVFLVGGAHAVAALAYGTETIGKVDKIVGPGNRYVTLAKKLVYGDVGIDMIAGPSEVVVVTDGSVDPSYVAADLMAQAEHDVNAMSVLIAHDRAYVKKVDKQIELLNNSMKRKEIISKSIGQYGFAVVCDNVEQIMGIVNSIAPEHLELAVEKPSQYIRFLKHAGAVFLGAYTPEVLGDYVAGPDHVLPTMGSARFSSGLGIQDFIKRTTLLEVSKQAFAKLAPYAQKIGLLEGLEAHALSIKVRR